MTISPFDIILLLGSGRGFILATLLWTNRKGNRLLASLIGLMALMSLAVAIPLSNSWVSLALDLLPLVMAMPLWPIIFFYTKSVLDPAFQLGPDERLQFYPVVLDWGAKLMGWVFPGGVLLGLFRQQDSPSWACFGLKTTNYEKRPVPIYPPAYPDSGKSNLRSAGQLNC